MNENKEKRTASYSSLTGFHRAIPIILAALAVFVGVCFITDGTGALGNSVGALLLGLFSYGAYAIPPLLILHAIFYAEDVTKKRVLSRAIFSIITVIFVSSIEYTVMFWAIDKPFTPIEFFKSKSSGGLIGSAIAYVLVTVFGRVGIFIVVLAVLAIYITFFFAGSNSALGRFLLSILGAVATFLAEIEKFFKKCFGALKRARKNKQQKEIDKKNAEFLDDQFFEVDNGMKELRISQLDIHEERNGTETEANPTLQTSVFHKSAANESSEAPKAIPTPPKNEDPLVRKRQPDLSYGIEDTASSVYQTSAAPITEDSNKSPAPEKKREFYGIDENADAVFNSSFDPFDFMAAEKIAAKPSSKAAITEELPDIDGIESMDEEAAERERRRAAFEEKKRQLLGDKVPRTEPSSASTDVRTEDTGAAAPVREQVKTVEFKVTNEPKNMNTEPIEHGTMRRTFDKSEHSAHIETETERAAAQIARMVASDNPTYTRSFNDSYTYMKITESPAEEPKPETVSTPVYSEPAPTPDHIPPTPAPAYSEPKIDAEYTEPSDAPTYSAPAPVVNEYTTESIEPIAPAAEQLRPYTPPTEDAIKPTAAETPVPSTDTLKVERTMLSPTPASEQQVISDRDSRFTLISGDMPLSEDKPVTETPDDTEVGIVWTEAQDEPPQEHAPASFASVSSEGTVFDFGDAEDEEDDEEPADGYEEIPEEEAVITDEIPPEEQNPDVLKQRELFPFLNNSAPASEPQEAPVSSETEMTEETADDDEPIAQAPAIEEEEEPEEDMPPFDMPEPPKHTAPVTDLVPATEAKKEEKPKKPDYSNYVFPPLDLLGLDEVVTNEDISIETQENADKLIETLASFNVTASIKGVDRGPRITRYEVVPAKGIKVSSVMNLQDDIALGLAADGIRMEAPIPGKSAIGVEIPNKTAVTVRLRELLETEEFKNSKSKTAVCIGKDVAGQPVINDIAKMPHLLIAGATGMGKSVCINSLMVSMLYKARPDEVRFIMIDPKQVEFTMYNGIPHLLVPVVSDAKQAAGALMWAVEEMERRYNLLNPLCVRNVDAYNEKVSKDPSLGEPMSRIVIVIDEFADLMLQVRDPVENLVMRIAQKARAAGIHLIIGTQRPAVNVITGTIKANVPSRISCKVASNVDSRTVLDASGAEKLLNRGDMLFSFSGAIKPLRVQGAFLTDGEVESVMAHLKQFSDGQNYDSTVMEEIERAAQKCSKKGSGGSDYDDDGDDGSAGEGYYNDRQFLDAVELAVNMRKISTSLIQRKISVGYGKAAKFIDIMEDIGIVGEPNGQKPREVLITPDEWREKLARVTRDD